MFIWTYQLRTCTCDNSVTTCIYAAIYRYTRLWSGFYGSNRSQMWFYYVQIPSFLFNSFWARRTIDFNFFRRLLSSDLKNCRSEKFSTWKMLKIENAKKSPKSILATFEIFDFQHFFSIFFRFFFSTKYFFRSQNFPRFQKSRLEKRAVIMI